jgi:hypothetical protein
LPALIWVSAQCGRDGLREQRVQRERRHLLGLRQACLVELDLGRHHGLGGEEDAEQVLLLLIEHRLGGGRAGDHRNVVALSQDRGGLGVARSVGREQEIDLVDGQQALHDLNGAAGLALIVVFDRLHLALLGANLDAAFGIHGVDAHVEALLLLGAFVGQRAGQRQRSADADRIGGGNKRGRAQDKQTSSQRA